MPEFVASTAIQDVQTIRLKALADSRGQFVETFRREWFPSRDWKKIQCNRSDSQKGVLRGLHFHRQQADYWYLLQGKIQAALCDLRTASPTCRAVEVLTIDAQSMTGIFIPPGVAHGFLSLTDVTLTYVVDNYYDPNDELGIAWNDPDLAIPWAIKKPVLSPRDEKNPFLRQLAKNLLP
jgi:dTDP-4-dehydrorhamnose 3,5-epimerase